jgi:preprotein translocase subunit SecA
LQVYRLLGLTVGLVCSGLDDAARREAYACSITYATNAELGFDYLRDNLALSPDQVKGKWERGT